MNNITNRNNVTEQYSNDKNLSTRMKLHVKHSTAQISLGQWLFNQYDFSSPCRILELGCGNGMLWEDKMDTLPPGSMLVLTDLSEGMVRNVWEKYSEMPNVIALKADIEELPFADGSFDRVIANHMLYHVPDIPKALGEVKRILKPGGVFYSSTNGNGGMEQYLHETLKKFNPGIDAFRSEFTFTLQNGEKLLNPFFSSVEMRIFEDSLDITDTKDLVEWIESSISISNVRAEDLHGLYDFFEEIRVREGSIKIPKEVGTFISIK